MTQVAGPSASPTFFVQGGKNMRVTIVGNDIPSGQEIPMKLTGRKIQKTQIANNVLIPAGASSNVADDANMLDYEEVSFDVVASASHSFEISLIPFMGDNNKFATLNPDLSKKQTVTSSDRASIQRTKVEKEKYYFQIKNNDTSDRTYSAWKYKVPR